MSSLELSTQAPYEESRDNEEIRKQDEGWFDLTPVEKKLCGISFGLGVTLLVVFFALFRL